MKVLFHWGKDFIRRVKMITHEDLDSKLEIPQGKFAKIHQRIMDNRKKKKGKQ